MASPAENYLLDISASMNERYIADCVTHACAIAELLREEGRSPWIGRLRHVTTSGSQVVHWPLIPKRFNGAGAVAWTTHYVACLDREVYDPILGQPTAMEQYSALVFGKELAIEVHFDRDETERLIRSSELRNSFRPVAKGL